VANRCGAAEYVVVCGAVILNGLTDNARAGCAARVDLQVGVRACRTAGGQPQ